MKFLFDFFPVAIFYVAYLIFGIYVATGVFIVATILQIGLYWFKHHEIKKIHLVTLILVTVLGGATIILQDARFIQWKVSVVNWIFGLVFFGSQFIGKKCLAERMMGATINVKSAIWVKVNSAWSVFFVAMGFLNLYVMHNFDEATWVNFKFWGLIGLNMFFAIGQGFYLTRHMATDEISEEG